MVERTLDYTGETGGEIMILKRNQVSYYLHYAIISIMQAQN